MLFLFISLPWLSNELSWSINKLKQGLWCTIWLSYTYIHIYIYNILADTFFSFFRNVAGINIYKLVTIDRFLRAGNVSQKELYKNS